MLSCNIGHYLIKRQSERYIIIVIMVIKINNNNNDKNAEVFKNLKSI